MNANVLAAACLGSTLIMAGCGGGGGSPDVLDVPDGIVARYACDGTLKDSAGSADGTASGGFAYAADRHGRAASACSFDGVDAKVHVSTAIADAAATGYSVTFWARTSMTSFDGSFLLGADPSSATVFAFNHLVNYTSVPNATNSVFSPLAADTWTHFAATYDFASRTMSLYKDGVSQGQETAGPIGGLDLGSLDLGQGAWPSSTYWAGALDEIRVYNRALSAAEAQQMYDTEK